MVEVGPLSGALSPFESWTRSPASTPNCDLGQSVALLDHAYQNPITRAAAAAILHRAGGQHAGTLSTLRRAGLDRPEFHRHSRAI